MEPGLVLLLVGSDMVIFNFNSTTKKTCSLLAHSWESALQPGGAAGDVEKVGFYTTQGLTFFRARGTGEHLSSGSWPSEWGPSLEESTFPLIWALVGAMPPCPGSRASQKQFVFGSEEAAYSAPHQPRAGLCTPVGENESGW